MHSVSMESCRMDWEIIVRSRGRRIISGRRFVRYDTVFYRSVKNPDYLHNEYTFIYLIPGG